MFSPVRVVPPREYSRCPDCHCFIRLDAGTCTACGLVFALASGSLRAETRLFEAQGVANQSGLKGNALPPAIPSPKSTIFLAEIPLQKGKTIITRLTPNGCYQRYKVVARQTNEFEQMTLDAFLSGVL